VSLRTNKHGSIQLLILNTFESAAASLTKTFIVCLPVSQFAIIPVQNEGMKGCMRTD